MNFGGSNHRPKSDGGISAEKSPRSGGSLSSFFSSFFGGDSNNGSASMTISNNSVASSSKLSSSDKKSSPIVEENSPSGEESSYLDKSSEPSWHRTQYETMITADNVEASQLRDLSWRGVPQEFRPQAWQMMLGYLPTNKSRRIAAIAKKRNEYEDSIPVYFDQNVQSIEKTPQELELLRQIQVDLPRTSPELLFFHQKPLQRMMERILYIWSIRHPASGYVQGMNDLLTPLLLVATQPYLLQGGGNKQAIGVNGTSSRNRASEKSTGRVHSATDVLRFDIDKLDSTALIEIEADAYWKFTKLLDGVQDHYTFSQPGLQRMVLRLEDLMRRHCPSLNDHFESEGIQYMQFAFRWMNCFLLREVPLQCILRLWDTYFAEEQKGFENFHVNVCAVLLKTFEEKLIDMPFQDIIMFLQELPTQDWGEQEIDEILGQAYILSTLYDNAKLGDS